MTDAALPFESFGASHEDCARQLNEDSFLICAQSRLWIVAYGLGGHGAAACQSLLAAVLARGAMPDVTIELVRIRHGDNVCANGAGG